MWINVISSQRNAMLEDVDSYPSAYSILNVLEGNFSPRGDLYANMVDIGESLKQKLLSLIEWKHCHFETDNFINTAPPLSIRETNSIGNGVKSPGGRDFQMRMVV